MEADNQRLEQAYLVFCQRGVSLTVSKRFQVRYLGGRRQIRAEIISYVGWFRGRHLLMKYHNLHADPNEYHHRIYDPPTGREIVHEILQRHQFPIISEVLDELQALAQAL